MFERLCVFFQYLAVWNFFQYKKESSKAPYGSFWWSFEKLEIKLPYDPATPLLGIYSEETSIEKDTCTPMFIAALFTIARTWEQPRCPSVDEWIKKLWYKNTMDIIQHEKEHIWVSSNEVDEPWANYTEWSKSEREI